MEDTIVPALVVFAILLAISLYGLFVSSAAAERLDRARRARSDNARPGDVPAERVVPPQRFETRL